MFMTNALLCIANLCRVVIRTGASRLAVIWSPPHGTSAPLSSPCVGLDPHELTKAGQMRGPALSGLGQVSHTFHEHLGNTCMILYVRQAGTLT